MPLKRFGDVEKTGKSSDLENPKNPLRRNWEREKALPSFEEEEQGSFPKEELPIFGSLLW